MIHWQGLAFGEQPVQYDLSTDDVFRELLLDPDAQFIHLVELFPYDDTLPGMLYGMPPMGTTAFGEFDTEFGGGEIQVSLSDAGFTTTPTDSRPNRHYKALINNPFEFDTSILSGSDFGNGSISYGAMIIQNGDAEMDYLTDLQWGGRRAVIKVGAKGFAYDEFTTIFDGAINDLDHNDDQITLTIRDNRLRTDQLIETGTYSGTGGLEGGDDIAGKPKPVCLGEVKNIEPVLIDPVNLIYQVNDGQIFAVDMVRDAGVALTAGGDVADINLASVAAGQFKTQLSGGYIKLGSTPAGRITADIKGDADGGYVSTAGEIVKRIAKAYLGVKPFTDATIDSGAFARIDLAVPGAMGIYLYDQVSASEVIDDILLPCRAYWTFGRTGNLTGGIVTAPQSPSVYLDTRNIEQSGFERQETIIPAWRISVGYGLLGVAQGEDELAGATTDEDRLYLGTQVRYVTSEDTDIRSRNDQAQDIVFITRLANKTDAETLLDRLKALYGVKRCVYRVPLLNNLYRIQLGDTARLTYPRYQLDAGSDLLVVGVAESADTGQTILTLWG